jgi:hypothetical protein
LLERKFFLYPPGLLSTVARSRDLLPKRMGVAGNEASNAT